MIRIVADSTSDLPPAVAVELGITIIPAYINLDEKSYRDGLDLTRGEFYRRLAGGAAATTSAPGMAVFLQEYRRLAGEGARQVISFHPSDRLSSLADMARLAAREAPGLEVRVVPGGFLALGGAFIIIAAARAAQAGCSLDEILQLTHAVALRTHTFAALETLTYLRRSGRVNRLVEHVGGWLQILPVLKLYLENIDMELARTQSGAVTRVVRLLEGLGPLEQVGIMHANAPQRAAELLQRIGHLLPPGYTPWLVDITPAIGVHIGPGGVGVAAVQVAGRPVKRSDEERR